MATPLCVSPLLFFSVRIMGDVYGDKKRAFKPFFHNQ